MAESGISRRAISNKITGCHILFDGEHVGSVVEWWMQEGEIRLRGYKTFIMLNSAENEI